MKTCWTTTWIQRMSGLSRMAKTSTRRMSKKIKKMRRWLVKKAKKLALLSLMVTYQCANMTSARTATKTTRVS